MVTTAGGGTRPTNWNNVVLTGLVAIVTALTIGGIYLASTPGGELYINASTIINGTLEIIGNSITIDGVEVATLEDLISGNISVTSIQVIRNVVGETVIAGTPMRFTAYNSGLDIQDANLADNTNKVNHADCVVLGTIADNQRGSCVVFGKVTGVDTSAWSFGDDLYLNETAGTLNNSRPSSAVCVQKVAMVLRSHSSLGVLWVSGADRCNDIPNNFSVSGNISASFFYGDGSKLTNLEAGNLSWNESRGHEIFNNFSARDFQGAFDNNFSAESVGDFSFIDFQSSFDTNFSDETIGDFSFSNFQSSFDLNFSDETIGDFSFSDYQASFNSNLSDAEISTANISLTRYITWNNFTGIPKAIPENGITSNFSTAGQIYTWAVGLFLQVMDYTNIALINQSNTFTGITQFTNNDVLIGSKLIHYEDNDTFFGFATNFFRLDAGGIRVFMATVTGNNNTVFNEESHNINFRMEGDSDDYLFFLNASEDTISISSAIMTKNLTLSESMVLSQDKYINFAGSLAYDNGTCFVVAGRTSTLAVC